MSKKKRQSAPAVRTFTNGDMVEVAGIPTSTLDRWLTAGLLGPQHTQRSGRGVHRTFTVVELLAVAAGVRWARAEAEPERVASVVRFIARLNLELIEANFAADRTFPVPAVMLQGFELPGTGGIFITPQIDGPAGKLFRELDLARCWEDVKVRIATLPERRVRGRKAKASKCQ